MQKPTLLEITQDILNDISGDEVSSIDDTVESIQVAAIVKSTWFDMMATRNWPHTRGLVQPLDDAYVNLPTHIDLSPSFKELISMFYDKSKVADKTEYREVKYLTPDDFLRFINSRNSADTTNVRVINDPSGITLNIGKSGAPEYFTSFNDVQVVLDSYDESVEPSLSRDKFQINAYIIPDWNHFNGFVPPLPIDAFPQLIEEAKSRAAVKLRQQPDQKAEQEAQRQRRYMARKDWAIAGGIRFPNYGRNPRHMQWLPGRDPTFRRDK